jgi:hypothetical protein
MRLPDVTSIVVILVVTCMQPAPAVADASKITAADFLEMNETYRAAMIHGLLASANVLGLPDAYQSVYDDGVKCRLTRGRQETSYQLASDFARYLDKHPEYAKEPFPMIFLIFMADCPKQ